MFDVPTLATVLGIINTVISMIALDMHKFKTNI